MGAVGSRPARVPLAALLGFAVLPLLFQAVIIGLRHVPLGFNSGGTGLFRTAVVTVAALSYWGIYGSLLLMFGATLRPGREALITAMARRMHGDIPEEMARYTRRVTQAWCCFFAFQLTASLLLFCFAPIIAWSSFVNILDIPMVAAMFAAEYFCRQRCLRDPPRYSLSAILNMVSDPRGNAGKLVPVPIHVRD